MRIGIDAKYYYSGGPSLVNVVRNIVNHLIENDKGHEIVFFLAKKDIHFKEDFQKKIQNKNNLSYVFIPVKFHFITNLLFYPLFFGKKDFDVFLFQNYVPLWGRKKAKFIAYVYDFLFLDYPQYFKKNDIFVYRFMISSVKRADHVITISESEKRRICKYSHVSNYKVTAIHPGLDPLFYEMPEEIKSGIKAKYKLPDKFILYVGRINIRKNIKTLLLAFSKINEKSSLVIVGKDDNEGMNFEEEITRLKIKDKVYRIGHLPDEDLAKMLSSATIFVFPSFAEGFGLPPLEAMKSGIPTIVSKNTSLPEVCEDGALYFEASDSDELAKQIDYLLTDKVAHTLFKEKGLKQSARFTWQNSGESISAILKMQGLQL